MDSEFSKFQQICESYNVPVIGDAAAQLPPRSNIHKYLIQFKLDFVIFSGGKAIGGPQSSGIIFAKNHYIPWIEINASPNEEVIGRPMKCDKELIVGLVVAFQTFMQQNEEEEMQIWENTINILWDGLGKDEQLHPQGTKKIFRVCPGNPEIQPNMIPRIYVEIDQKIFNYQYLFDKFEGQFKNIPIFDGKPTNLTKLIVYSLYIFDNVALNCDDFHLILNPQTLNIDEALLLPKIIKNRLSIMVNFDK